LRTSAGEETVPFTSKMTSPVWKRSPACCRDRSASPRRPRHGCGPARAKGRPGAPRWRALHVPLSRRVPAVSGQFGEGQGEVSARPSRLMPSFTEVPGAMAPTRRASRGRRARSRRGRRQEAHMPRKRRSAPSLRSQSRPRPAARSPRTTAEPVQPRDRPRRPGDRHHRDQVPEAAAGPAAEAGGHPLLHLSGVP
jgi:hypothetical protein